MLEVLQLLFSVAAVAVVLFLGVNTVRDALSHRKGSAPLKEPRRQPVTGARDAAGPYGVAGHATHGHGGDNASASAAEVAAAHGWAGENAHAYSQDVSGSASDYGGGFDAGGGGDSGDGGTGGDFGGGGDGGGGGGWS